VLGSSVGEVRRELASSVVKLGSRVWEHICGAHLGLVAELIIA